MTHTASVHVSEELITVACLFLFLKVGQKDAGEQPISGSPQVHPGTKEQTVVLQDCCPLTAPSAGVLSSLDTVLRAVVNDRMPC